MFDHACLAIDMDFLASKIMAMEFTNDLDVVGMIHIY